MWSRLPTSISVPNVIPLCITTLVVTNVIIIFSLILITTPSVIPGNLFINPLCAHAVFEKSTDREWHNPSGTSSDGRGEQSCLDVGNSKLRWILSTINNHLLFDVQIAYYSMREREREKIYKGLWTDTKRHHPTSIDISSQLFPTDKIC